MKLSYYAVFQYDVDGICISFPDVPSALTCANDEEAGLRLASEALVLALHDVSIEEIPVPSLESQIILNQNQKMFRITMEMGIKNGKLFSRTVKEL